MLARGLSMKDFMKGGGQPLSGWLVLLSTLVLCVLLWPCVAGADGRVRLGVVSERPDRPSKALEQYGPLNAYLERRLSDAGVQVADLVIARDLAEMARFLDAGEVDVLIEGVIPTLTLERDTQRIRPSLLVWRKGQRQYHSLFFVRRDSPITGLQDLAGRTIAFESKRSTSAYFVPLFMLRDAGLEVVPAASEAPSPGAVRYHFAGSELNQAYWVHDGRADVGAFNDGDWERTPAAIREELRVIAHTPPLLRWLVSFSTELDTKTEQAVSEVLLEMHQNADGQAALAAAAHIARLEHLSDDDRANLAYWSRLFKLFD